MNRHILREEALVAVQSLPPNTWAWSLNHREVCRIVDREELWGDHRVRVWLPTSEITTRVSPNRLRPIGEFPHANPAWLSYVAAAARVAEALTHDLLLATIGSSVIPLPHQIYALFRAMSGDRVRYLLADEVGLGKTVEAGLIMRELKMRGLAERILVVAPKGAGYSMDRGNANPLRRRVPLSRTERLWGVPQGAGGRERLAHLPSGGVFDGLGEAPGGATWVVRRASG